MTKIQKIFLSISFILSLLFLISWCSDFFGIQSNIFFKKTENFMADYYNVAAYSADRDPYYNEINGQGEHAYLPITYIIFYILSKSGNFTSDAYQAFMTPMGILVSFLFLFSILLLYFKQLDDMILDTNKIVKYLFSVILFFSSINLLAFERGNTIYLSAACLLFFINFYDSDSKIKKNFAFMALAFSAALKVFPAIFGILLVYEKKWKDSIKLMLYGLIVAVVPFFSLDKGLANIPKLLENIQVQVNNYKYAVFPRYGISYYISYFASEGSRDVIYSISQFFLLLFCVYAFWVNKWQRKKWKRISLLLTLLLIVPSNSALYCGLYIFPVLIYFFNDWQIAKIKLEDYIYMILFILILNPFQVYIGNINLTLFLHVSSVCILAFLLVLDATVSLKQTKSNGFLYKVQ